MKTSLGLIIFISISYLSAGQNNSTNNFKSKSIYRGSELNVATQDSTWTHKDKNLYLLDGNVGIGTENPQTLLEIHGKNTDSDGNISNGLVTIKNNNYSRFVTEAYSDTYFRNGQIMGIRGRGTFDSPSDVLPGDRIFGIYGNVIENNELKNTPLATIEYYVGDDVSGGEITFSTLSPKADYREERMRINQYGNVGIGTNKPIAKLHVADGDIYIEDISRGIIMKSPNGQCWRGTLNNSGNLVFSKIDCPENDKYQNKNSLIFKLINIYPNPTNQNLMVEIENYEEEILDYEIVNMEGKIISSGIIHSQINIINTSKLPNAMHLISFYNSDGKMICSKKFIKRQ
jgi:hypothetical protein